MRFFHKKYNSAVIKLLRLKPDQKNWQVGVFNNNDDQYIHVSNTNAEIWYADPFLFQDDTGTFLFVELFSYKIGFGVIAYSKLGQNGFDQFITCIKEDFHLSFPRIFIVDRDLFMTVESSTKKGVRVYRSIVFPDSWELVNVVNECNFYKDPIIIAEDNIFHLIVSSKKSEAIHQIEFFSSQDIFTTDWNISHANPIPIGKNNLRNGGLITTPTNYVWVLQTQKFGIYGFNVKLYSINRPIDLNNLKLRPINNNYFMKPKNVVQFHTLNAIGNLITFDFKK